MKQLVFKCWKKFFDEKKNRFDGKKFESLVSLLLEKKHGANVWMPTQDTWDGKKDFYKEYQKSGEKNYDWAECKMYQEKISINVLAPTLIMSTINPINEIIFFSYSPLNSNAKKILADFAAIHKKIIKIYDDEKLENIIIELLNANELENFFLNIPSSLSTHSNDIIICQEEIYVTDHEQSYNAYEFQKITVKLYELLIVSVTVENTTLSFHNIDIIMDLHDNYYKYFEITDKKLICKHHRQIAPGEILTIKIPLRIIGYSPYLHIPQIIVDLNGQKACILDAKCNVSWLIEAPFIGYQNELNTIEKSLCQKNSSIICIWGRSGMGKTRFSKEVQYLYTLHHSNCLRVNSQQSNRLCKVWIRKIFSSLFCLPIVKVNELSYHAKAKPDSDEQLIMHLLYDNEFEIALNREHLAIILLKKLAEKNVLLIIDNVQDYDEETHLFINEIINYLDITAKAHLMLIFNEDYLFSSSMALSIYERLKYLVKEDKVHYRQVRIKGFSDEQALIYVNHCLNLSYSRNNALSENRYCVKKILSIAQNNPLFLEQIFLDLSQNGIIICIDDHFQISDDSVLDKYLDSLPNDIHDYWNQRIFRIKKVYSSEWTVIKNALTLIVFFEELPKNIFDNLIENELILPLLINSGLVKKSGNITFYHQLIQYFFKDIGYNINKKLMRKCLDVLKNSFLLECYPAQYYICYFTCNKGTPKLYKKAIQLLLNCIIPDNLLIPFTNTLLFSMEQNGYLEIIDPKTMINFFIQFCYSLTRKATYQIAIDNYEIIYVNYLQKYGCFKQAGYAYAEFLKNYFNTLLVLNRNADVLKGGLIFLNNIDNFTFTGFEKEKSMSSIYNRMHIAANRIEKHIQNKPYSSNAIEYLDTALMLANLCEDTRRIIQNEIDYGNMYFLANMELEQAKLHWNKAKKIYEESSEKFHNWRSIIYYNASIAEILNKDYAAAMDNIEQVCIHFRKTMLNPFFYIKANILKAIVYIFQMDIPCIMRQIDVAQDLCNTYRYTKGYPICAELYGVMYEHFNNNPKLSVFYYKKALKEYCKLIPDSTEQENNTDKIIYLATKIRKLKGFLSDEDYSVFKDPEILQTIYNIMNCTEQEFILVENKTLYKRFPFWCNHIEAYLPSII